MDHVKRYDRAWSLFIDYVEKFTFPAVWGQNEKITSFYTSLPFVSINFILSASTSRHAPYTCGYFSLFAIIADEKNVTFISCMQKNEWIKC